jgi:hypothetical protein
MQQPFRLPILGRPGQLHIDSTTFCRIWDKTGKPTEAVCSAFLAQSFLLSPAFLRGFTEHVYHLAHLHRDIDVLFSDPSVIGVEPPTPVAERLDIFVQFGSHGVLAIENKTECETAFTDQQLHRYSQVLRGVQNSVLVLLCPSDYPLCEGDCPPGTVVMTYLELLKCIDGHIQRTRLNNFEHQYFAALRHFFRRIEVCAEEQQLTRRFSTQNVGDIILCMYPGSNEGTAYEGVFVTRVDKVNHSRVTLTNFYDEKYPLAKPVAGAHQHGWFSFCETGEYSMTLDARGRLKLLCAEYDMHCYAQPLSANDPRRFRVPMGAS